MRTRPMTVVSLRICRHPSVVSTHPDANAGGGVAWRIPDPGGGKDGEQPGAGRDLPFMLKNP